MKTILSATAFFAATVFASPVLAANGNVSCSLLSTTLTFNAYNPISGAADTLPTGTFTVQCTSTSNQAITVTYSLTLATTPARAMSGPASLTYDLYTDSARTLEWNTTNLLSCSFSLAALAVNQQSTCSFYGNIPGGQDVPAGTYTQTGLAVGGSWSCNPTPNAGC